MRANQFRFAPAFALAIVAFAPHALAQPKPAKPPKPAAPAPSPPPAEAAPPADLDAKPAAPTPSQTLVEPPSEEGTSSSDVTEKPGKTYYYIGARYRMNVVPKFMINLFVDEGATVFSNTVGIELDVRKDGFSFIPAVSYVEYGTGDILFREKGKPAEIAGNWSNVNSSLKAIYITADLLWSSKLHKNVDFEYGAGFGLGILTGGLETSWVYKDNSANAAYRAKDGSGFSPCISEGQGGANSGCNKVDHQNSTVAKVNHYSEPSWANGGSKPNVFLHLAVPQFGLRIKAAKEFEARIGIGFSLTGFWAGVSGNFGLEKALGEKSPPQSLATPTH